MKKLISLILFVAMTLSLSVPAFATDSRLLSEEEVMSIGIDNFDALDKNPYRRVLLRTLVVN